MYLYMCIYICVYSFSKRKNTNKHQHSAEDSVPKGFSSEGNKQDRAQAETLYCSSPVHSHLPIHKHLIHIRVHHHDSDAHPHASISIHCASVGILHHCVHTQSASVYIYMFSYHLYIYPGICAGTRPCAHCCK